MKKKVTKTPPRLNYKLRKCDCVCDVCKNNHTSVHCRDCINSLFKKLMKEPDDGNDF